jgi:hypothetical protein
MKGKGLKWVLVVEGKKKDSKMEFQHDGAICMDGFDRLNV